MSAPDDIAPVAGDGKAADTPETSSVAVTAFNAIPPPGLVLLAIAAIQIGAGVAIHLFPILGAEGTVAYRILFSVLLLLFAVRRRLGILWSAFRKHWLLLVIFGVCIGAMNLFFYQAIARIPLGAAVTIEFIGPLGIAVFGSRRLSHFLWVSLAVFGIVLLSPISGGDIDSLGVMFALLAGGCWAAFIVLAKRMGQAMPGNDALVVGMTIAAILMLPYAVPVAGELFSNPLVLAVAFGVALLSTTIPFTLEFHALKRMTTRAYGILISLEPAVGALVGAVILGERIGLQGMIAVACVVVAAIGITYTDRSNA
ncbi:MAG: EamA family transporter [Pseudomonadota bacterium]